MVAPGLVGPPAGLSAGSGRRSGGSRRPRDRRPARAVGVRTSRPRARRGRQTTRPTRPTSPTTDSPMPTISGPVRA